MITKKTKAINVQKLIVTLVCQKIAILSRNLVKMAKKECS
jgi:hypothetical protein